jgi:hypothetical protein
MTTTQTLKIARKRRQDDILTRIKLGTFKMEDFPASVDEDLHALETAGLTRWITSNKRGSKPSLEMTCKGLEHLKNIEDVQASKDGDSTADAQLPQPVSVGHAIGQAQYVAEMLRLAITNGDQEQQEKLVQQLQRDLNQAALLNSKARVLMGS